MTQSKKKLLSNQTINCEQSQDQTVFNATMINPIIQQFEELDILSKEIIKQQVESKMGKPTGKELGCTEGGSPKRQK